MFSIYRPWKFSFVNSIMNFIYFILLNDEYYNKSLSFLCVSHACEKTKEILPRKV